MTNRHSDRTIQAAILVLLGDRSMTPTEIAESLGKRREEIYGRLHAMMRANEISREKTLKGNDHIYSLSRPPTPEEIAHEAIVAAAWEELKRQLDPAPISGAITGARCHRRRMRGAA